MDGEVVDVIPYTFDFIRDNKGTKIFVGADSQVRRYTIKYAVCIVYRYGTLFSYTEGGVKREIGKGCHVLKSVWEVPKRGAGTGEALLIKRLMDEITTSIVTAETLRENAIHVEQIDFDLNDDDQCASHKMVSTARGWATGLGYKVSIKPDMQFATKAANHIVNH